ncbi:MAG TPA: hypothetical protein VGE20_15260 [Ramlibacter sp.]
MPNGTDAKRKHPIQHAREKTRAVREELEVAGAELELTTTILERALPPQQKDGDVRKAMEQNGAVAANVAEASEELAEVEALLAREIEERQRLEREIARRAQA